MKKAPKVGTTCPIRENGAYTGMLHSDRRGEVLHSAEIIGREIVLFHSSDWPLRHFKAQETCFYEGYCISGYIYALHVPVGTEIRRFRGGEIRVDLSPKMRIVYLGRMISKFLPANNPFYSCVEVTRYTGLVEKYLDRHTDRQYNPRRQKEE